MKSTPSAVAPRDLSAPDAPHSMVNSKSVLQEVAALHVEWLNSANAHDTDRHLALYIRQPSLVFAFNGTLICGWDALYDNQMLWWNGGETDVSYAQQGEPAFVVLGSDSVLITSRIAAHATLKSGQITRMEIMVTMTWQRLLEGWRIVQAHESSER